MIAVEGKWYDGRTSAQLVVLFELFDNGAIQVRRKDDGQVLLRQSTLKARVSDRLGDTPRFLSFPDGSIFETKDNQLVDEMLQRINRRHWMRWVHLLESEKRYVALACIIFLMIAAVTVRHGIPQAAKFIAARLPVSFHAVVDRQTLQALDKIVFNVSELPEETQRRVRGHMQEAIDAHAGLQIRMLFRKGGKLGPNAFAMPGGTIVFTDEMVALAEHDDELLAVMAHEIGHLVHQHGIRRMVQDSLLSFAVMALTGDASGVSELFLGLPVVLTELAYSREFERDADRYALAYLQHHHIAPQRFADILARIDKSFKDQKGPDEGRWSGYLSTHPPTPERVNTFRAAGRLD